VTAINSHSNSELNQIPRKKDGRKGEPPPAPVSTLRALHPNQVSNSEYSMSVDIATIASRGDEGGVLADADDGG
jgi:hypothetical protein